MKSSPALFRALLFFVPIFSHGFVLSQTDQQCMHPRKSIMDTNVVIPPVWTFGVLYGGYTNQEETIDRIKSIIDHDYPIDAYWIDSWFWNYSERGAGPRGYIDFTADTASFPDRKKMWSYMESKNIKGGFWVWDCIFKTGNEKAFSDFNDRGFFRDVYIEKGSWHNHNATTAMYETGREIVGTPCGNINFTDPDAVEYFKGKMRHFFDEGADFIKLDRTSSIPVCKAMFEMTQEYGIETNGRGFILSHTGGMESGEYKNYPAKWTDDTRADWTIEEPTKEFSSWVPPVAFKENIAMFTDSRNPSSRIPFLANDLGGFDIGRKVKVDEELYIRWMQFSIFTPIVELFSQPENPTSNLPYLYSGRADELFRHYSHLRMQLFPYIYSYAHQVRLTGRQMIRKIPDRVYDYFFGNELLIAPVYEKGALSRELMLPEGEWIDFWTDEVYKGDTLITVDAPIEIIPVFVRSGTILPVRNYSRSVESGSNDTLIIHIYPAENSEFSLIEDDGSSNDYLSGIYSETIFRSEMSDNNYKLFILPSEGSYKGMNSKRSLHLVIHCSDRVSRITVNNSETGFASGNKVFRSEIFQIDKNKKNIVEIIF